MCTFLGLWCSFIARLTRNKRRNQGVTQIDHRAHWISDAGYLQCLLLKGELWYEEKNAATGMSVKSFTCSSRESKEQGKKKKKDALEILLFCSLCLTELFFLFNLLMVYAKSEFNLHVLYRFFWWDLLFHFAQLSGSGCLIPPASQEKNQVSRAVQGEKHLNGIHSVGAIFC